MKAHASLHRQRGVTIVGWMMIVAIAVFFIILAIKLIPPYLEHYSLRNVLDDVAADPAMRKKSPVQLRKILTKRFKINSVYDFDRQDLVISKTKEGGYNISIDYVVEKPMVYNISALLAFEYEVSF